jgi:hypothetical protein
MNGCTNCARCQFPHSPANQQRAAHLVALVHGGRDDRGAEAGRDADGDAADEAAHGDVPHHVLVAVPARAQSRPGSVVHAKAHFGPQ